MLDSGGGVSLDGRVGDTDRSSGRYVACSPANRNHSPTSSSISAAVRQARPSYSADLAASHCMWGLGRKVSRGYLAGAHSYGWKGGAKGRGGFLDNYMLPQMYGAESADIDRTE